MLPIFRLITAVSQRAERLMTRFIERMDLTPSQFDVLATLGDTSGMPFKDLSQQSLVTGGTLTPVLNRMESKGLISRCRGEKDSRQTIVSLTPEGQRRYEESFLPFVDHAMAHINALTPEEQQELVRLLLKLQAHLPCGGPASEPAASARCPGEPRCPGEQR
jgi:DNA-binding MarR family transcriptional regulator